MRLAVMASRDSWYLADLRRAAADRHVLEQVTFRELAASVGRETASISSGSARLDQFDALIVRTMPPGSLEQIVFRMNALAQLEAAGMPVINSPRALEVAVDKYLALVRLQAAGLNVPRTVVCQTADVAMEAFARFGGEVVLKPLFGSEGRGIARIQDEAIAERTFRLLEQLGSVLYVQEYLQHVGADLRAMVIGERALWMERRNPLDWRTNVARGATPLPYRASDAENETARCAAAAVGASLAGVDLLPARDGQVYVLEVNAVPGWKAISSALDVDVANLVLEYVCRTATKGH